MNNIVIFKIWVWRRIVGDGISMDFRASFALMVETHALPIRCGCVHFLMQMTARSPEGFHTNCAA
ncbi:hypothetical protein OUZ56_000122 [Daphnia magna]|uniref:Uncharacterized protein n=1 Tax=Daphnia magna TaxID=35525 RepID=A0ABQ9ZYY0_9CRUS|nr:hypothetical protein OUZ56_000122 [Daphnia magna]